MIFDMGKNLHKLDKTWDEIALKKCVPAFCIHTYEPDMEKLESVLKGLGKFSWEPGATMSEKAFAISEMISVFGFKEHKDADREG